MNIFTLIANASVIVQLILLVLLFFSVFSWTIIIFKRKTFRTATEQNKKFLDVFKKSRSLTEVNESAKTYHGQPGGRAVLRPATRKWPTWPNSRNQPAKRATAARAWRTSAGP